MAYRYELGINPTYQEMAVHYGAAILQARVRKPRNKAKAEVGVQLMERWYPNCPAQEDLLQPG
ncbi:hypothetical protein DFAR_1760016 [Desulfarculales bacterium]